MTNQIIFQDCPWNNFYAVATHSFGEDAVEKALASNPTYSLIRENFRNTPQGLLTGKLATQIWNAIDIWDKTYGNNKAQSEKAAPAVPAPSLGYNFNIFIETMIHGNGTSPGFGESVVIEALSHCQDPGWLKIKDNCLKNPKTAFLPKATAEALMQSISDIYNSQSQKSYIDINAFLTLMVKRYDSEPTSKGMKAYYEQNPSVKRLGQGEGDLDFTTAIGLETSIHKEWITKYLLSPPIRKPGENLFLSELTIYRK